MRNDGGVSLEMTLGLDPLLFKQRVVEILGKNHTQLLEHISTVVEQFDYAGVIEATLKSEIQKLVTESVKSLFDPYSELGRSIRKDIATAIICDEDIARMVRTLVDNSVKSTLKDLQKR